MKLKENAISLILEPTKYPRTDPDIVLENKAYYRQKVLESIQ